MSGPLSVPATFFGLWLSNDIAKAAFILMAFVCLWVTAYRIWKPEREKVEKLTERLTPKLSIGYLNKDQCHSVSEFRDMYGVKSHDGMCFRLEVDNLGTDTAVNCEGRLTEVYYEGERPELGPMKLTWAGTSDETALNIVKICSGISKHCSDHCRSRGQGLFDWMAL